MLSPHDTHSRDGRANATSFDYVCIEIITWLNSVWYKSQQDDWSLVNKLLANKLARTMLSTAFDNTYGSCRSKSLTRLLLEWSHHEATVHWRKWTCFFLELEQNKSALGRVSNKMGGNEGWFGKRRLSSHGTRTEDLLKGCWACEESSFSWRNHWEFDQH
jgi:hypothetical protein